MAAVYQRFTRQEGVAPDLLWLLKEYKQRG
jgi:hypothetical protein